MTLIFFVEYDVPVNLNLVVPSDTFVRILSILFQQKKNCLSRDANFMPLIETFVLDVEWTNIHATFQMKHRTSETCLKLVESWARAEETNKHINIIFALASKATHEGNFCDIQHSSCLAMVDR
ncbi:hypothetical protein ACJX0J_011943 [Zea mays]